MKIYLDLDGPILDIRRKCWEVHSQIINEMGGKPFRNLLYYWEEKQKCVSKKVILKECGISPELEPKYLERYVSLIEKENYLEFDRVLNGVKSILSQLSRLHTLVLITGRRNLRTARGQIRRLNLDKYFVSFLIAGENFIEPTDKLKMRMILQEAKENGEMGRVLVGDSEGEILAAKSLNITSVAVLGGVRSEDYLAKFNPTFTIKHLRELLVVIQSIQC